MPAKVQIARILKSDGTQGRVLVSFPEVDPEQIEGPVYIDFDGLPVPFFIEEVIPRGSVKAIVRFTGTSTLEDAEELVGRSVWCDALDDAQEEDFTGWKVLDENGTLRGTVSGVEPIPGIPCLLVDTENGQMMLPLHEDLILSVDEDSRELQMTIPDGLL